MIDTLCGMFYCDISDHLPCFISFHSDTSKNSDKRPMTRIFGTKNCATFVTKMSDENWNKKYMDNDNDWYHKFISIVYRVFQQSFPLVRVSRERFKDKPWMTKGLRISIKHKNRLYRTQLLRPGRQQIVRYNEYKILLRKCLKEAETN